MLKFISKFNSIFPSASSGNSGSCIFLLLWHLVAQISFLTKKLSEVIHENEQLKSKLRLREAQLFGTKSEKQNPSPNADTSDKPTDQAISSSPQHNGSTTKPQSKPRTRGGQPGHKGYGRKLPSNLSVTECVHEIPEQHRQCEICNAPFKEIPLTESSYEVDVEIEYILTKHIRQKYKKTCNCPHPIITAPKPDQIIPKGKYSTGFWCKILIDKFLMQIPIHRQVFQMKLNNIDISKGTIFNGFKFLSKYLLPLYEQFRTASQSEHHHHTDETRWKVFTEIEGKKGFNWWLWVFVGKKVVFYIVDKTRSAKVLKQHLKDNINRILSCDRYSAYKTLTDVLLAFCWSHVRRDFLSLITRYPHKKAIVDFAQQWLKWIGQLYAINNQRLKVRDNPQQFKIQQETLETAILKMKNRLTDNYALPEQQQVITSLVNHWQGLTLFVDNPDIPMDNNIAENMLRTPVVGRKNYYGNHSEFGGLFSAVMFTITQTCILHNINPDAYLKYYFTECAKTQNVPQNLERFMPHRLKEHCPKQLLIQP